MAGIGVVEPFRHRQTFQRQISAGLEPPRKSISNLWRLFHLPERTQRPDTSA